MKKKSQIVSDNFSVNLNRALRFLSFRPRSEKEVRNYLFKKISNFKFQISNENKNKKTKEEIIETIITKLKQQRFLDDVGFTKWWIEQRTRIKPKAVRLIKFELKQKGIARELIDEAFKNLSSESITDFEKALELTQKRMPRYKNETPKKIYEKMGRFLASKGFDWDIIKKVIDQVLEK